MAKITRGISLSTELRAEITAAAQEQSRSFSMFLTEIVYPEWRDITAILRPLAARHDKPMAQFVSELFADATGVGDEG